MNFRPNCRWLRAAFEWGNREPWLLLALAVTAGALWLYAEVVDAVLEGEARELDRQILLSLRDPADPATPRGPFWLEEVMRDLTALGGVAVLALMTLASCGFLLLQRKRHTLVVVVLAIGSGIVAAWFMKLGFDRPRPELVPHGSIVYTASFPSGHSMMAALVYLTLGALLAQAQPDRRLKVYLIAIAVLITVLVGISRIYLGVHWPTDVVGGWAAGAAWALLFWIIGHLWRKRMRRMGDRD